MPPLPDLVRRGRALALPVVAAGLALAATVAVAQPAVERVFDRLDTDRDDVIEPQEIETARRAAFDRADADRDGYVTGAELEALRREIDEQYGRPLPARRERPAGSVRLSERADAADKDGDGRIAEAELVSAGDPWLLRFDTNGDGSITRAEMSEGAAGVREGFRRRRGAQ